ncbi:MAG: hypothetical protein U0610_05980 [bacterium]
MSGAGERLRAALARDCAGFSALATMWSHLPLEARRAACEELHV